MDFLHISYKETNPISVNSLASARCSCNVDLVIYNRISIIEILSISCKTVHRRMPQGLTDD